MDIVIFHNPNCGTSRNVVRLVQDAGYTPNVVEYLQSGWTKPMLQALFAAADITPRQALRVHKSPAEDLGLTDKHVSDDQLLDAMVEHPILVNRPLVACPNGTKICRPSGAVLPLLDNWPSAPYAKEDGSLILDNDGNIVPGA
ncbi:MAG: arsenate reductase (glutaredoxin), partial [Planktomarina sp.]